MSDVMVLGGGVLGRCLGHEDGALVNGISAFVKGPRKPASPYRKYISWSLPLLHGTELLKPS